ncbi:hypothetical protein KIN20_011097 [Parelaphostrongylus tenuis]|uniref:E3 ubiquitin-protein ligase CBL n=1 Tax=Parelaphostrongylus tenuis TaxID=148309 RepID=A0AAD5QPL5_PARTN|nr:hypothetical protein KIN20_011097 [Parelaphostrongylus tenuis]
MEDLGALGPNYRPSNERSSRPGYVISITYDKNEKNLGKLLDKPGSYVSRPSCTGPEQRTTDHVTLDGEIFRTKPQNKFLIQIFMVCFVAALLSLFERVHQKVQFAMHCTLALSSVGTTRRWALLSVSQL